MFHVRMKGEQELVRKGGESRLAAVLISPFGAKCVSPERGLSVLGRPTGNQVSPPISSPALFARFHPGTGHAHTHTHTYTYTHRHYDHEGGEQTAVVYLLDSAEHVERLKVKSEYTQWSCLILLLTGDQSGF